MKNSKQKTKDQQEVCSNLWYNVPCTTNLTIFLSSIEVSM